MRWFKQLFTGRKEAHKGLEENHVSREWSDGAEKEKRWSFVRQRKSGVDGGGRPSGQAAVAAASESPQVKSCHSYEEEDVKVREEKAAILIQKAFRGYLVSCLSIYSSFDLCVVSCSVMQ